MNDYDMENLKVPPQSIEAEQSVIGGLMLDNNAWAKIADRITEQDFYRRDHQIIFTAIKALCEENQPCDIITISEWLKARGKLDVVGGLAYLGGLAKNTPSAYNIVTYADIVREFSVLRSLVRIGTDIASSAFDTNGKTVRELLETAEREVFSIRAAGKDNSGLQKAENSLESVIDHIDLLMANKNGCIGLASGFSDLDKLTMGFRNGDFIIVAGRPSMGKTTFAMNIGENVVFQQGKTVGVFSLEMPREQIILRTAANRASIDIRNIDEDKDMPRLYPAISDIRKAELYIDDTPALTPYEIKARAKRFCIQNKLDLLIVDYLQLMSIRGKENRTQEVSEISRQMKAIAKELNIPVIALSQLNRSLEQRQNKRPVMSDLRESGGLEQDADMIIFLYRDEVYNTESNDKGVAEAILAKNRNGPLGTARLGFQGKYFRFHELQNGPGYDY